VDMFALLADRLKAPSGEDLWQRFRRAAVLVPLAERPEGVAVLLERRSEALRQSAGEVGLPGGRVEEGESAWEAGVRELEEELGIERERVRLLGELPVFERGRGELIFPFVCALEGELALRPSAEVAEAFWLPLELISADGFRYARIRESYSLSRDFPSRHLPGGRWRRQASRPTPYLLHEGRLIWGLTADILVELARLLR